MGIFKVWLLKKLIQLLKANLPDQFPKHLFLNSNFIVQTVYNLWWNSFYNEMVLCCNYLGMSIQLRSAEFSVKAFKRWNYQLKVNLPKLDHPRGRINQLNKNFFLLFNQQVNLWWVSDCVDNNLWFPKYLLHRTSYCWNSLYEVF